MKSVLSALTLSAAALGAVPAVAQERATNIVLVHGGFADAQRFFAGRTGASVTEIAASHSGLVSQAAAVPEVIDAAAH